MILFAMFSADNFASEYLFRLKPACLSVVRENVHKSSPFVRSGYRIIGKLLSNEMMRKWLRGEKIINKVRDH